MVPRELKTLFKEVVHALTSPSPYRENSNHAVQEFQSSPRPQRRSQAPSPYPASDPSKEIQDALAAHNAARRSAPGVSRPDLKWSRSLAASAQRWADHLAATGQFMHEGKKGEGENIWSYTSTGYARKTFLNAVEKWLDEESRYNGEKLTGRKGAGHYTQIIWPGTTHVGMGKARRGGRLVVVARYWPSGNIIGRSAWEG